MRSLLRHVRANAVAYLALFIALGGTGYAAMRLPAGSVGNRQIRNHSIDPDKFNPRFIRGEVRVWASVNASGRVVGGGRGLTVVPQGSIAGDYLISPAPKSSTAIPRRCAILASVDDRSTLPGYADAEVLVASLHQSPRWQVVVNTFARGGQPASLPFDVAVIC
jgi:hypothetical protein